MIFSYYSPAIFESTLLVEWALPLNALNFNPMPDGEKCPLYYHCEW